MRRLARAATQPQAKPPTACPCASGLPYTTCCGPFHRGDAHPPSPARLFRARFSAYALGLSAFIIDTTAEGSPAWEADRAAWTCDILRFHREARFIRAEVLSPDDPAPDADAFAMDYRYTLAYTHPGRAARAAHPALVTVTERGLFRHVCDRWRYCECLTSSTHPT
jgi:uncharacterized protein YchJ